MKQIYFLIFCLLSVNVNSQEHEVTLASRFGIANSQFKKLKLDNPEIEKHARPYAVYDHGIGIEYKYRILKKANIYLSTGAFFSKSQYTFVISNPFEVGAPLEQVLINKNRFDIQPVGLSKRFNLFQDNLILEVGLNIMYRYFYKDHDRYLQDTYLKTSDATVTMYRRYKYDINVHYGEYFGNPNYPEKRYMNVSGAYSFTSKYRLTNNMYFNVGLFYQRNYYFAYDYSFDYELKFNDGSTGVFNASSAPTKGFHYMIKDDFLNFTFGVSYLF